MVAPRGPCSLDISAISHGEPWGEAAAKLTGVSTEPVRGTGIPRELRALPCPPAPLGAQLGLLTKEKEEPRVLFSLAPELRHGPL